MRKDVSGGHRSKFKKSEKMMRKDFSGGQRSKFKKSQKMIRKDVTGGGEVQNQKIQKNDEKRLSGVSIGIFFCDRRLSPLAHLGPFSYFSYDGKMMRKDVSGG